MVELKASNALCPNHLDCFTSQRDRYNDVNIVVDTFKNIFLNGIILTGRIYWFDIVQLSRMKIYIISQILAQSYEHTYDVVQHICVQVRSMDILYKHVCFIMLMFWFSDRGVIIESSSRFHVYHGKAVFCFLYKCTVLRCALIIEHIMTQRSYSLVYTLHYIITIII